MARMTLTTMRTIRKMPDPETESEWQAALRSVVESIAGLTAVDGATVVTNQFEVLAFGAKIMRRQ